MKDLICFDLDNTLIKSDGAHINAFVKAFSEIGLKVNKKKLAVLLYGLSSESIIKKLFPNLKNSQVTKLRKRHDELVTNETGKMIKPIKRSQYILKKLKKKYEVAIVSNCRIIELKSLLETAGITRESYNFAIGKDEVKRPKPYPDELFKAEKLSKHRAICMVGDSIFDVMAADRKSVV